jgi:hypothetical protein
MPEIGNTSSNISGLFLLVLSRNGTFAQQFIEVTCYRHMKHILIVILHKGNGVLAVNSE